MKFSDVQESISGFYRRLNFEGAAAFLNVNCPKVRGKHNRSACLRILAGVEYANGNLLACEEAYKLAINENSRDPDHYLAFARFYLDQNLPASTLSVLNSMTTHVLPLAKLRKYYQREYYLLRGTAQILDGDQILGEENIITAFTNYPATEESWSALDLLFYHKGSLSKKSASVIIRSIDSKTVLDPKLHRKICRIAGQRWTEMGDV